MPWCCPDPLLLPKLPTAAVAKLTAGLHHFVVAIPGHLGFVLGVVLRELNLVGVHCAMGLSVVYAHINQYLEHFTGCNQRHIPCCCPTSLVLPRFPAAPHKYPGAAQIPWCSLKSLLLQTPPYPLLLPIAPGAAQIPCCSSNPLVLPRSLAAP
jgi:hypothetical protein